MVHIIYILDESGSMSDLAETVKKTFNGFISEQKTNPEESVFSLITFNNVVKVVIDHKPFREVPELTSYFPNSGTALLDAIGETIVKNINEKRTMLVIMTDGYENSSYLYTKETVKGLIKNVVENNGWSVIYHGANQDAITEGCALGISLKRCLNFEATPTGIKTLSQELSQETSAHRNTPF